MAQLTFENVWKPLAIAWLINTGVFLLSVVATYSVVAGLGITKIANFTEPNIRLGILLLGLGYALGMFFAYRYLKKNGFIRAAAIVWLSTGVALVLPLGALIGYLGLGFIIEREARKQIS